MPTIPKRTALDALPARVNQHVAIIRASDGVPPRYIHLHLLQVSTKSFLLGMDAGASRQAVSKGHIESVPLVLPPAQILHRFQEQTAPIFEAVNNNTSQASVLASVRDTLLPRLLSGELSPRQSERLMEVLS